MNNLTKGTTVFALCATAFATLSIGYNVILQWQINKFNTMRDLAQERDRLLNDTFQEMLMTHMNNTREKLGEISYQQGKIEGMATAAQNLPPEKNAHSAIWHAGYERGLQQVEFIEETAYTNGYHKATEDMNCPANSPLRREETARKAFAAEKEKVTNTVTKPETTTPPIPTPNPIPATPEKPKTDSNN